MGRIAVTWNLRAHVQRRDLLLGRWEMSVSGLDLGHLLYQSSPSWCCCVVEAVLCVRGAWIRLCQCSCDLLVGKSPLLKVWLCLRKDGCWQGHNTFWTALCSSGLTDVPGWFWNSHLPKVSVLSLESRSFLQLIALYESWPYRLILCFVFHPFKLPTCPAHPYDGGTFMWLLIPLTTAAQKRASFLFWNGDPAALLCSPLCSSDGSESEAPGAVGSTKASYIC